MPLPTDDNFRRRYAGLGLLAFLFVLAGCNRPASEQAPVPKQMTPFEQALAAGPAPASEPKPVPWRPSLSAPPAAKDQAPAEEASSKKSGARAIVTKRHPLGSFTVASGELIVSDPLYDPPTSEKGGINGLVPRVKKGSWSAFVHKGKAKGWGERCFQLETHHVDHPPAGSEPWAGVQFEVGVDTGQAGIFDRPMFADDSLVPPGFFANEEPLVPEQLWYSMCCKHTISTLGAGVIPGGAVSSSGVGDGGYECQFRTDKDGSVVGVRIVFLTENDF
jgi:hypothetical protein